MAQAKATLGTDERPGLVRLDDMPLAILDLKLKLQIFGRVPFGGTKVRVRRKNPLQVILPATETILKPHWTGRDKRLSSQV
jgi:hypothetical protein